MRKKLAILALYLMTFITNGCINIPAISPTGKQLIVGINKEGNYKFKSLNPDIELYLIKDGEIKSLTNNNEAEFMPIFSPDEKDIIYGLEKDNAVEIHLKNLATGIDKIVAPNGAFAVFISKNKIAYIKEDPKTSNSKKEKFDLYTMDLKTKREKKLSENVATFKYSHNGNKIAYKFIENDDYKIGIINSDGSGKKKERIIGKRNDGTSGFPLSWSKDDTKLIFVASDDNDYEIYEICVPTWKINQLTDNNVQEDMPFYDLDDNIIFIRSINSDKEDALIKGDIWRLKGNLEKKLTNSNDIIYIHPGGNKILYVSEQKGKSDAIFTINNDGKDKTDLTEKIKKYFSR